ncbi:MAG: hypothetical protein C9356_20085 [Oleiphilus sp.]|nr:MAG: hypothetical protein C9356_20085 [Oleiphilus sp.]
MRLLPNYESALRRAELLTERLDKYFDKHGRENLNILPVYWLVFSHTFMAFKLLVIILLSLSLANGIINTFDILSVMLALPVLFLIGQSIKQAFSFTNEFVIEKKKSEETIDD